MNLYIIILFKVLNCFLRCQLWPKNCLFIYWCFGFFCSLQWSHTQTCKHTFSKKNKKLIKSNYTKKKKQQSRIQYGNTACGEACRVHLFVCTGVCVPSMEERLGSMVTAPTATSSSWWIGLLLAPQLSDPIHRKWPTWLALLVALRTPLQGHSCVNLERTREVCAI